MLLIPGQGSRQAEALGNPGREAMRSVLTWSGECCANKRGCRHGRSEARGTGARTDGRRESECCIVALTTGNGVVPGPAQRRWHVSL